MIAKVYAKDGTPLYTPVKANEHNIALTEALLRRVAARRTKKQLMKDFYFATALAAKKAVPY